MVLDDSCMVTTDLRNYVMGEVKLFSSVNNLRVILSAEGFSIQKVVYLGGLWVMFELPSANSKSKFLAHVGVRSWFKCLSNPQPDFSPRDRIIWVDVEGVPMHAWSSNTFHKIGSMWGEVLELGDCKDECFAQLFVWSPSFVEVTEADDIHEEGEFIQIGEEGLEKPIHQNDVVGRECIEATWNSINLNDSNAMVRFKKKLQALKKVIRLWIGNYKRNQMNRTIEIKIKLKDIDKLLDQLGANDDLLSVRSELLKQYHDIHSVETCESIQKAKIKWAVEGDENSKFFHGMINRKRANLAVKGVMIDGEWVDDPSKVKDEFRDYFASRFCDPGIRHGVINFNFPNRLNIDQSGELEAPISRDEIRRAVWDCGENKSPGPDGFTFEFFRKFWNIVGPDLCLAVEWFFHHASFPVGCNSSFIALIPKTLNPKSVGEYRPVSLIGSIYKIVTKILANRLSTVLRLTSSKRHLSHLFYADDAVFIGEWSRGNLTGIMHTLRCFSLLSGLSINLKKSQLLVIGENMSSIRAWDETVNKLKMSLSSWKLKTLSIGGRLTLLKSKKIAWVSWSKVLASKSNGGLGVSSFYALNRGLLFKWIWRFLSRDQSLWAQVIHALHGSNTSTLSASYSSLWSSIIKECNALKSQGLDLISHCKIRVGNGMSTSFWHDQWLGDSCLRLSYPRLFALENNKVCSVAAKMSAPFVSSLRRDVRGGEESAQLSRISDLLDTVVLSNMGDRRFWDLNGDGCFRVKDVRRLLDDMLLPKSDVPSRWVKQIPIKVNVLAWKISMDRLPTRVNLHRRGVQVSPISCPICCEALENLDHLLFCCDLAKDIARSICNWWGLVWNPVDSYRSWLSWFNLVQLQSSSKQVLEGVFYTSWWSIWSYRNHLLFSDSNLRKDGLVVEAVLGSDGGGEMIGGGGFTEIRMEMDRISQLPEFIIHHILSLLDSPKELVRMGVLSENWFDLTASFPILDFDYRKVYRATNEFGIPFRLRNVKDNFLNYVAYTMAKFLMQSVSVHTFNFVTEHQDDREVYALDKCLGFILTRGVKVLVVNIGESYLDPRPLYHLPNRLSSASALTSLTICRCVLPSSLMVGVFKFNCLKLLELESALLHDEVIMYLTTNCLLLEEIKLKYCYGFKRFCVSRHLNLQKVEIEYVEALDRIEIDAPNLSFLYLIDYVERGLRRFLDRKNGFKVLKMHVSATIEDVKELKAIQSLPYELEHVELEMFNIQELSVYLAVLEAHAYEKLLQQENGQTNIEIVLSPSFKAKERDINSLRSAIPRDLLLTPAVTFTKKEGTV
ncbi:RNA-directed DNA polymerase, eukaryota [Tanacetum coccineum]|uniref:RNA-directed DNA polymerase, eukaryota n=1 Tax=Tanacetum coccineum TaxID=301880 RepID=A0ABQ5B541_9ASTR